MSMRAVKLRLNISLLVEPSRNPSITLSLRYAFRTASSSAATYGIGNREKENLDRTSRTFGTASLSS